MSETETTTTAAPAPVMSAELTHVMEVLGACKDPNTLDHVRKVATGMKRALVRANKPPKAPKAAPLPKVDVSIGDKVTYAVAGDVADADMIVTGRAISVTKNFARVMDDSNGKLTKVRRDEATLTVVEKANA